MVDIKKPPVFICRDDTAKPHEYAFDKRVFIVNPVYRKNGENTKEILTKLMREEARDRNATQRF